MRLDDVIRPGSLTNYQLESIFLFADETRVVTFPMAGARLRELLEHGVSDSALGKGAFLQVSGVTFTYDQARPSGKRLVGEIRRAGGGPISANDTVRVAFDAYPACQGGDGYQVPEAATSCPAGDAAPRAVDLLMRYLADSLGGQVKPPSEGRILRSGNTNPG
jgi:5'-nucleotidase